MIGIMADSHGQIDSIRDALAVFDELGCRSIYHLGDVCDSAHPETANACIQLLQNRQVKAIKGNNDQVIVANHCSRETSPVSKEVLETLRNLDLAKYHPGAMFIHSLPFIQELGLSSLIGAMGAMEIRRYCREFPGQILFRGHSHNPEIAWLEGQQVKVEILKAGVRLNLANRFSCVVTCGALTQGLCMIWNPDGNYIQSISFHQRITDPDRAEP
jgi:predicted phosphodiesterase